MRSTFINTLVDLAQKDDRIVLLTADLGYNALEPFAQKFPNRFINVGVAEQNMIGIATGLAEAGFMPFAYSIITFATLRPYEFIRNGPIAHNLPVRIVGVGGGMEYSHNGLTHFGVEDIAVMRTQPRLSIFAPADAHQTETILRSTWNIEGPAYYRLGKDDRIIVPGLKGDFTPGELQLIREGKDCLLISMGAISYETAAAAAKISESGLSCAHAVLATINPTPKENLIDLLSNFRSVYTVESHYLAGGIGSLIAELIAENGLNCRLTRLGLDRTPDSISGDLAFLHHRYGLSPEAICQRVMAAC